MKEKQTTLDERFSSNLRLGGFFWEGVYDRSLVADEQIT